MKGVDVMPFEVDGQTKMPIIPPSIEEKLTRVVCAKIMEGHTEVMDNLDKELGIGDHQDDSGAKEIRESWASAVSGKKSEPTREI